MKVAKGKGTGRLTQTRIDARIQFLDVPVAWQVGHVTFRPPGWLRARIERDLGTFPRDMALDRSLADWPWSSASTTMPARRGDDAMDAAQERFTDAIALARLYQRACLPRWGLDNQTFGLVHDISGKVDTRWRSERRGLVGVRAQQSGVLGGFTFERGWIRSFRSRPAFAFLDDALRLEEPPPGSWAQRGISAIRALNAASPMQSQPIRIALQAVALEALLGDDPTAEPWKARGQAHPVAQRAAFLTCAADGLALEAGGTACINLTAQTATAVERDPRLARRPPDYWDWPCTEYWHIREVFGARNEALHDARDTFPRGSAMRFEGRVDDIILAALDWAVATGAGGISDLDVAIAQLPRDHSAAPEPA